MENTEEKKKKQKKLALLLLLLLGGGGVIATAIAVPIALSSKNNDHDKPGHTDQEHATIELEKITTTALGELALSGAVPTNAEITTAIKALHTNIDATTTFEIQGSATATEATVKAKVGSTLSTTTKIVTYTKAAAAITADSELAKVSTLALGAITMVGTTPTNTEITTAIKAINSTIDSATTFEIQTSPAATGIGATVKAKVGSTLSTTTKAVTYTKAPVTTTAAELLILAEAYFTTAPDLATTVTSYDDAYAALLELIVFQHTSYTYRISTLNMGAKTFRINITNRIDWSDTATTPSINAISFTAYQYDVNNAKTTTTTTGKLGAEGPWTSTMTEAEWNAIAATTVDQDLANATYITGTLKVVGKTVPTGSELSSATLKYAITKDASTLTFTVKIAKGTGTTAGVATAVYTIAKPVNYTAANAEANKITDTNLGVVMVATSGAVPTADELKVAIKAKFPTVDDGTTWAIQTTPTATNTSATVKAIIGGVTSTTSKALMFTVRTITEQTIDANTAITNAKTAFGNATGKTQALWMWDDLVTTPATDLTAVLSAGIVTTGTTYTIVVTEASTGVYTITVVFDATHTDMDETARTITKNVDASNKAQAIETVTEKNRIQGITALELPAFTELTDGVDKNAGEALTTLLGLDNNAFSYSVTITGASPTGATVVVHITNWASMSIVYSTVPIAVTIATS